MPNIPSNKNDNLYENTSPFSNTILVNRYCASVINVKKKMRKKRADRLILKALPNRLPTKK